MATAMGTDAVGFVFAPSPRQVQPTVVRDIARRLPPEVLSIGVFRDESPQRVVEIVHTAGLRGAQLHGFETPAEVAWVAQRVPFVVKAFSVGHPMLDRIDDYNVDAVLLDAVEPGSGQLGDWEVAARLAATRRVLLAGGLRPDNVAAAITEVGPWGVDVSSGVESSPGHKDVRLTRRFIAAAHAFGLWDDDVTTAGFVAGVHGAEVAAGTEVASGTADGPDVDEAGVLGFDTDVAPPGDVARSGDGGTPEQGTLYDWGGE